MSIRANVDARALDQRVTFQRNVPVQGGSGGETDNWIKLIDCAARVDGARANGEPYVQNGIRTVSDYTFWVRADIKSRFNITTADRILWNGTPFDISDLPDQQLRGRLVAMFARAGVNNG